MMESIRPTHDYALFGELTEIAQSTNIRFRTGQMFGSPSLYVGKRMAACVYGDRIGLKVPVAVALETVAEAIASPFRPNGRAAMREWIEVNPADVSHDCITKLLIQAFEFAEKNNV